MSGPDSQVHLDIGSQYENIELVQVAVESSLLRLDLDDETAHSIAMAVREAVANAIRHGNRLDPEKRVELDCEVGEGEVVIRISDEGEGFDLDALADPLDPENLLRPNGRGIFFMKTFMDDIDYRFRPGVGTVVTLRKQLTPPAGAAGSEEEETK